MLCALTAASLGACGGGPSSPSGVSRYPEIVGTWSGTRAVEARFEDGSTSSNVCFEEWTITSQSDSSFAGEFRIGGGVSSPCGPQRGSLAGAITTSGAIINMSSNISEGQVPCLAVSRSAINGGFSERSLDVRYSDEIVCVGGQSTFRSASRTVALALARQ